MPRRVTHPIVRVADRDEPWMPSIPGPEWYLKLDEISIRALAEGVCLVRVQQQAHHLVHFLGNPETPTGLFASIDCGTKP